jgi:hypothetical protein
MVRTRHAERQIAEICVFVHGVLAAFHLLGIVYNLKQRNRFDVLMHSVAAAYDLWATDKHLREVRWLEN